MKDKEKAMVKVEERLGHTFQDETLLRLALTHPSYAHEHPQEGGENHHNQRLEFLGDAVLDFLIAAWLYDRFPDLPEGDLTRLRATLVCTESLAALARHLHLGEALRLGRGEEEYGGRDRDANLCDAMEALSGALYLDAGIEQLWTLLHPWFERSLERILTDRSYIDAKSRLQEWAQAELRQTPTYRIVREEGPDHAKIFTAQALLDGHVVGEGSGRSKRVAEQAAAADAIAHLLVPQEVPTKEESHDDAL